MEMNRSLILVPSPGDLLFFCWLGLYNFGMMAFVLSYYILLRYVLLLSKKMHLKKYHFHSFSFIFASCQHSQIDSTENHNIPRLIKAYTPCSVDVDVHTNSPHSVPSKTSSGFIDNASD